MTDETTPQPPERILVTHAEVGPKAAEGWKVIGEVTKILMEKPK